MKRWADRPGGLLAGLTKRVLETALKAELRDHLCWETHDPVGRNAANPEC
jgi:putative transposase